jgi:hypothetical protein
MSPGERQETLRRHGLTETEDGFELTLRGFQRALALRERGDREAARRLALNPPDPLRWEFARCLAIDSFTTEVHQSEI